MKKPKKYKVTSKVRMAFTKRDAFQKLVEMYVKEDNHHRAKQTAIEVERLTQRAWESIYEIYPKLRGVGLTYKWYYCEVWSDA